MAGLTPKQARFAEEYLIDLNATRAAIRAGYSEKTAEQQGYQLLQKALVREAVEAGRAKMSERTQISADDVLRRINGIAEETRKKQPAVALKGLELLAKHLGMFTEKHEYSGEISVRWSGERPT